MNGSHTATIRQHEEQRLSASDENAFKRAAETMKLEAIEASTATKSLPPSYFAAMGLSLAIDFVPTHAHLPPIPRQHSALLPFQA